MIHVSGDRLVLQRRGITECGFYGRCALLKKVLAGYIQNGLFRNAMALKMTAFTTWRESVGKHVDNTMDNNARLKSSLLAVSSRWVGTGLKRRLRSWLRLPMLTTTSQRMLRTPFTTRRASSSRKHSHTSPAQGATGPNPAPSGPLPETHA